MTARRVSWTDMGVSTSYYVVYSTAMGVIMIDHGAPRTVHVFTMTHQGVTMTHHDVSMTDPGVSRTWKKLVRFRRGGLRIEC